MNKDKLEKAVPEFFKMVENHKPRSRNYKPAIDKLPTTKDFVFIGGTALLFQDIIDETSDVDAAAMRKGALYGATGIISIIDEKKIQRRMMTTDGLHLDILKFKYADYDFEIFERDSAEKGLSGNLDVIKEIELDGINVYVRPAELIKKDYEKMLKRFKLGSAFSCHELADSEKFIPENKIKKYEERLKLLKKY